ncbi:endonuclease/exonuclease/phosphatase family protein [Actinokineospora auranticolor]|uniref:endonuclease/exonuclease/phosphatase family protein n=1 Tax=Actinokineospora auranticolor TaxID=155976 RepID=UPI0015E3F154|nr:endonuclease/exonuclease/phosphatase family protein [Actinokineospora auranticolor]
MAESTIAYEDQAQEQPGKPRRRRGVTVFLAFLLLPVLALGVLRLGGIDGNNLTVAALSLTPYAAGFGLLVTLVCLLLRRRSLTLIGLVASLSLGVLLLPRILPDGDPMPQGQHLRVLTANLMLGKADPQTLVNLVRDTRTEVLFLQELTPAALDALDAAGVDRLLPYRVVRPMGGASGSGILAKVPLRQIVLVENTVLENPAAVLDLSGPVDIEVVAVHIVPPVNSDTDRKTWQRELASLPNPDSDGRPRILAGDFNATLDHNALTSFMARGYDDGAEKAGEGMRPTWSSLSDFGPPVTIDHILVDRRIAVPNAAVYDLPGSDHNALFAEVALPD